MNAKTSILIEKGRNILESAWSFAESVPASDGIDMPHEVSGEHRELGEFTITRERGATECILASTAPLPPAKDESVQFLEDGAS